MSPEDLAQVLRLLPSVKKDPNLIVGTDTFDDAGVYKISEELALVQSLDFFTPVVDDPFTFGQIAAANALSDIYAMGGRPLTALNLVAFPNDKLEKWVLAEILKGGMSKIQEAGATLVGGHTVDDPEPKYGLAVTGVVHPDKVVPNSGARPKDRLVLTKPLGVGVITTAMKHVDIPDAILQGAVDAMASLNAIAAEVMHSFGVRACTDITGFGFLGHLHEMAMGSGLSARIESSRVPMLPGAVELTKEGHVCGGSKANLRHLRSYVTWDDGVDDTTRILLCDAITSGGLLIAAAADQSAGLVSQLQAKGIAAAVEVGEIIEGPPGRMIVT